MGSRAIRADQSRVRAKLDVFAQRAVSRGLQIDKAFEHVFLPGRPGDKIGVYDVGVGMTKPARGLLCVGNVGIVGIQIVMNVADDFGIGFGPHA